MALKAPPGMAALPYAKPTRDFAGANNRADVLTFLVRSLGWTHGVEIGTGLGRTTEKVLANCPGLRFDTCDPWIPQPDNAGPETWVSWPHEAHMQTATARLARFADRCTVARETSAAFAKRYADGVLDFVFIDGDHGTAAVSADIETWAPKVKADGMVIGHDINWPTVEAAVARRLQGYWVGPDNTWGRWL